MAMDSIKQTFSSLSWSLYMISFGQGGYNPSFKAFGADQLQIEDEIPTSSRTGENSRKKSLFFHWWYFGIWGGSLLGVSLMSYIQDKIGWGVGFAIPTIAMVTSIAFFSCGSRFYTYKQEKSVSIKSFDKIVQAIKATASKLMNDRVALSGSQSDSAVAKLVGKPFCHHQEVEGKGVLKEESNNNGIYLPDMAKVVVCLLPIWSMLLMFAIIFQQPAMFFTRQGMAMKRNIARNFKIPPASLQNAITVYIILLMSLYDTFFIPFALFVAQNDKGVSIMRMGVRMFLSVIAMVIAANVKTKRLKMSKEMGNSESQAKTVPFSIFWLLPQFIILRISDIFTVVGMQEFFYTEVPEKMRTMGITLYTSVFGVRSFVSALLILLIEYFTSSKGGKCS